MTSLESHNYWTLRRGLHLNASEALRLARREASWNVEVCDVENDGLHITVHLCGLDENSIGYHRVERMA